MSNRVTVLILLLATFWTTRLPAEQGAAAWETIKVKNGMTILEQRQQIQEARQIIQKCDRLVAKMKEQDRLRLALDAESMAGFLKTHRFLIEDLIAEGQRLKPVEVHESAGQIPIVTNVVLISMSYEGSQAFETMLRLYEEDKNAAMGKLDEIERRMPRRWTSKTGRQSVVAEFVSACDKTVTIRRLDNRLTVCVPIHKLSLDDRQFIQRTCSDSSFRADTTDLKPIGIERRKH